MKKKGYFYLAETIYMPAQGYMCRACLTSCDEHDDIVLVEALTPADVAERAPSCYGCDAELTSATK